MATIKEVYELVKKIDEKLDNVCIQTENHKVKLETLWRIFLAIFFAVPSAWIGMFFYFQYGIKNILK